ncbi:MAG: GAF domain-containing protein [Pyrinomonadaceae bacterium]
MSVYSVQTVDYVSKSEMYTELKAQARELFTDEHDSIANAANLSSLVFNTVPDLNWVGFYFLRGDELVLGPFQGLPACIRIGIGKGVCGTAAQQRQTILVENVHEFPGHIVCDSASNSEIVIPLIKDDQIIGVFDIDSPKLSCFDREDQSGLESLAELYLSRSDLD